MSFKEMMMFRNLVSLAVALVTVLTVLLLALPSQQAQACLPCYCPENRSLNCFGDYAVYTNVDKNDNCKILILDINPDNGRPTLALDVSARRLARLPETPKENVLIDQYYEISLFKLTSGEYQVNVGPDAENKVKVLRFMGCPATDVFEEEYKIELAG